MEGKEEHVDTGEPSKMHDELDMNRKTQGRKKLKKHSFIVIFEHCCMETDQFLEEAGTSGNRER